MLLWWQLCDCMLPLQPCGVARCVGLTASASGVTLCCCVGQSSGLVRGQLCVQLLAGYASDSVLRRHQVLVALHTGRQRLRCIMHAPESVSPACRSRSCMQPMLGGVWRSGRVHQLAEACMFCFALKPRGTRWCLNKQHTACLYARNCTLRHCVTTRSIF
ncbi:hypothetical protein COO60DRAFT_1526793 [Scenedesmus sp. NREL 46B-D3]|nr:hypothetical protein COO60DRAFT_1526793 [Scenedesmus sp. NREL 46B-D3]